MFRRFSDAWAVFEGSDFDIDEAVAQALQEIEGSGLGAIDSSASLYSLVAKRHYHETGALRWFDVTVSPLAHIEAAATAALRNGAIGQFVLALPMQPESMARARRLCRKASIQAAEQDTVIGLSSGAWGIPGEAKELAALERVRDDSPKLHGDRVARTEVLARIATLRERIESDVARAFEIATWYHNGAKVAPLTRAALNGFASTLADRRYCGAPRLRNELLARTRPSSNAVAARNILLRRMVSHEFDERLGIEGFPAEGGLYVSLLEKTRLHRKTAEGWGFRAPEPGDDPCGLAPLWERAMDHLRVNAERAVPIAEIHDAWRRAPYGVKDGLLPVLSVAFMLSQRNHLAVYREGLFQSAPSELDADYLAREPADIQLRWMDLTAVSRCLLSELANLVRDIDDTNTLHDLKPIDVAKGLVAIHDRLPPWVGRTQRLTRDAIRIRRLLRNANDPNRLLFNDIPALLGDADGADGEELDRAQRVTQYVRTGLAELSDAYPAMLGRLREILLSELQVPNASSAMLNELRGRAENVRELGGDHRLEAFIVRLVRLDGSDEAIEGLAGMAVNRPVHAWTDADVDRAGVELASMARQFVHVEAFARVKGRKAKRHAIAVIVGLDGQPTPVHGEFKIGRSGCSVCDVGGRTHGCGASPKRRAAARNRPRGARRAERALSSNRHHPGTAPADFQGNSESVAMSQAAEWHVLGLSGGRDSAALAVHMRQHHPELEIDYFFTDTGKELPEVYEFLGKLEGFLGKPIVRLNPDRDFDFWLRQYNDFLPSAQSRWCTRQLKLRPFEQWIRPALQRGTKVCSYVAIRADENYREGYSSRHENLAIRLPLKDAGIDKVGVMELLEGVGLGLPAYYEWRSRSGCTFCFFQQKIEWVRLLERHPDAFEEACAYEKTAVDHGSPFTWSQGESLDELRRPERIEQIKCEHERRIARVRARMRPNPLRPDRGPLDMDELYGPTKMCLACHK